MRFNTNILTQLDLALIRSHENKIFDYLDFTILYTIKYKGKNKGKYIYYLTDKRNNNVIECCGDKELLESYNKQNFSQIRYKVEVWNEFNSKIITAQTTTMTQATAIIYDYRNKDLHKGKIIDLHTNKTEYSFSNNFQN